ncbi:hypothetical protein PV325_008402 [Microctonus aethiopoides]|nr:hypothetical protein PV325_008402 [Microctonus aethiopoides]
MPSDGVIMGTWHLEIARMILYIGFPVGLFHWFNQPQNFTEYVENTQKEMLSRMQSNTKEIYDEFVGQRNERHDLERIQLMEAEYLNSQK